MSATLIQWDPKHDVATRRYAEPGIDSLCLMPWRFIFIQEHLKKVYACCFHKRPFGDLETHSLEEIWNNEAIQGMRQDLLEDRVPQFCYNNSASCPIIYSLKMNGQPDPTEMDIIMGLQRLLVAGRGLARLRGDPRRRPLDQGPRGRQDRRQGPARAAGSRP